MQTMPETVAQKLSTIPRESRPAPLENGERMTAPEFFHRYEAMPHVKKAELIEGIVYMGSPVRIKAHASPDSIMHGWLSLYAAKTPGVDASANGTIQLDLDNVPQPDGLLRIETGGSSHIEDDYLVGPPELVIEIAASSKNIDSHDKLKAYRRNGVKEYLIWRTLDGAFDWFRLEDGNYNGIHPDDRGLIRSGTFPGLVLNVKALLAMDRAGVTNSLLENLDSPEHREFVKKLAGAHA